MKLSFIPANLHVTKENGEYVVTMGGIEVMRSRSEKVAVAAFNRLRAELESKYPARTWTAEELAVALRDSIADGLLGHNSTRERKKKSTAGGSRTFGG